MRTLVILVIIFFSFPFMAVAEGEKEALEGHIRAHYQKFEYRIPMRDGSKLFTAVYTPNDASEKKTYPIIMARTPYSAGPYGANRYPEKLGPSGEFAYEGYIFVMQDVRGRFMSEGEFVNMRPHRERKGPKEFDESTDTYDTVEWLLENVPHHNGRVGIWGNSYLGFYTSAGIINTHPAIKAALPSAPISDWYFDDMHHHGAFSLLLTFNFFSSFGVTRTELVSEWPERFDHKTPDGYQFFLDLGPLSNVDKLHFNDEIAFWNSVEAHPNYDSFWQSRNILPHLKNISAAVLTVGGLFDSEDLYGPWKTYASIEEKNAKAQNSIVMGPWRHGAWLRSPGDRLGDQEFGFPTGEDFRRRVLVPFFNHHLKGGPAPSIPEAMVFETGANRWREFDHWPPKTAENQTLFFGPNDEIQWEAPDARAGNTFAEFPSDPDHPVPYTTRITDGWNAEYMTEDQRFASRRPDVLTFRSEVLTEDLTLAGELFADLWVSTTGEDADWVVKLVDEWPGEVPGFEPAADALYPGEGDKGGSQLLVRSEILRGRYRNSYEHPEAFESGKVTRVTVPLQGVLHTFLKGHRVMVQIQSSLFPFFDRNPQSWVPNIFEAKEEDFIRADHRVYFSADHPSALRVKVLPRRDQ